MTAHCSVLLKESVHALAIKPDGVYVDGTFGRGGHSRAILNALSPSGRLIAIDKDLEAIAYATQHFSADARFCIEHGAFTKLTDITQKLGVYGAVDGILLDLGVSSPQLDTAERGFSFMQDAALDMRMDTTQALDAARFIQQADANEMADVFRRYGEERFAGRIARAIVAAREIAPIVTTGSLAAIVKEAHPKWEKHKHPATRVFQAIRIHINQELTQLTDCLMQCVNVLATGGRLAVISFHSLEDRIVKQFMRSQEQGLLLPKSVPVKTCDMKMTFQRVGKAVKPTDQEVRENIRSRSAVLRVGEKLA